MAHRKVLVIGMFDSIHLARWLKQFEHDFVDFILFPSKKFRHVNPELYKLLKSTNLANYSLTWPHKSAYFSGYIDYIFIKIGSLLKINFRRIFLKQILKRNVFDYVHALEIQGAGYLYSGLPKNIIDKNKLILTNWGSDIYFFAKDLKHNKKISEVISIAQFYSAECERDYDLLKNYNFQGSRLPCIPNGGGFTLSQIDSRKMVASERTLILCKGYGGQFGQADLAISAIDLALGEYKQNNAFFYSVTADVENAVIMLKEKYKERVNYSTVSNSISREKLLNLFGTARVYIGCSKSDAISTSFLEALVYGAYPIQTNTSCADEWIIKGANATLVGLNTDEIYRALQFAIEDDDLVNLAQTNNHKIVREHLDENKIKRIAAEFYSL